jgi:branched-chain amino acid transport system permease protein
METTVKQKRGAAFNWQTPLQIGAIAGIVLLYLGAIGMLATLHEREIVRDVISLGQILIYLPALIGGFQVGRRVLKDESPAPFALISGAMVGLLAALPTIIIMFAAEPLDVRNMFTNINRDWLELLTFDNRGDLALGSLYLAGALAITGMVGALLTLLPARLRRALIFASLFTLIVGAFGETMSSILEQLIPEDLLDTIFRRNTLLAVPALILFVVTFASNFGWSFVGGTVTGNYQALPPSRKTLSRQIAFAMLLALLLVLPWVIGRALSDVAVTVGLFVLMGLGLNIAIGLAGLLDLGYVTNYAVGAYVMAVLTSTGPLGIAEWSFWLVIPVALLSAMLTGFIFAVPVLKMRGDYLAIATLGFGEIIGKLAISDALRPIIGGAQGVLFIPKPMFFGTELKNPEQLYYIILVACLITLFVSIRLNNSRTGRQWMAIREDEDVAAAMGIDVARSKLLAFTLSAATGGVAGAIFATKVGAVFPNSFIVLVSINVLSLIIVGGMGSNPGIVLGALVLIGMPELLREFSEYRWLLYGALLIFMMINRPEGLIPSQVRRRELQAEEPLEIDESRPATAS